MEGFEQGPLQADLIEWKSQWLQGQGGSGDGAGLLGPDESGGGGGCRWMYGARVCGGC